MESQKKINIPLKGTNSNTTEKKIYDFLLNKKIIYRNISTGNISTIKNIQNCKTPNSGSVQNITVCEKKTYKGPVKTNYINHFKLKIDPIKKIIDVDSNTMNLFIQKIINELYLNNKINKNIKIEHFLRIINNNNKKKKQAKYLMEGTTYSMNYKNKNNKNQKMNNLYEYIINIINKLDNDNVELFNKNIDLFVKWIKDIFEALDILYKKIKFHHCDPKAAQLFIDGDITKNNFTINVQKIVLADLDKVTFSVKLNNECYRVLTKAFSNYSPIGKSIAEKMRPEEKARVSNIFEKACFLVSILLAIKNDKFYIQLLNRLFEENKIFIEIYKSINKVKFFYNKTKNTKSHKKASECIDEESLYKNGKKFINYSNECSIINFQT